jgi:hypothetical protein
VAHSFTMVLSRRITADETTGLREYGVGAATDSPLPTDPSVTVTVLEFAVDADSLEPALEAALAATRALPEVSVRSLTVRPPAVTAA